MVTSLNIPLLQKISAQTSGTFLNVVTTGQLAPFFSSFLTSIKAREISHIRAQYRYLDKLLLIVLLLGLLGLGGMHINLVAQYLKNK